jgi:hypothetical protein
MSEALGDSWNISDAPFPAAHQPTEQMRFPLQYAILAPSTHNTQPWLFEIRGDALELYTDRAKPAVSTQSLANYSVWAGGKIRYKPLRMVWEGRNLC